MKDRWERLATIAIDSQLSVSDTSYFYDEPVIVSLPSGAYAVDVQYGNADGHPYVRSLRVVSVHEYESLERAQHVGVVVVDFGQICVCDRAAVAASFDRLGDAGMQHYYDQLNTTELVSLVTLPDGVVMPIVRPGFGDGRYAVYELRDRTKMAGVEVDCETPVL
jgi:hypothetical protein